MHDTMRLFQSQNFTAVSSRNDPSSLWKKLCFQSVMSVPKGTCLEDWAGCHQYVYRWKTLKFWRLKTHSYQMDPSGDEFSDNKQLKWSHCFLHPIHPCKPSCLQVFHQVCLRSQSLESDWQEQTRPASHNLVEMQDRRTAWEVTIFRGWHHSMHWRYPTPVNSGGKCADLKTNISDLSWSLLYNYLLWVHLVPRYHLGICRTHAHKHTELAHTQTIESSMDNVMSIVSQY